MGANPLSTGIRTRSTPASAVVALLVFLVVNAIAAASYPLWQNRVEQLHSKDPVWGTINTYRQLAKAPDVVFLGSSLMLATVTGADISYVEQHKGALFSNRCSAFEAASGAGCTTFVMATPGQFVSDACLLVEALCNAPRKPKTIIYGIGPRDFMDNLLVSASATQPFRCLQTLNQTPLSALAFCANLEEATSMLLSKSLFLYRQREAISAFAGLPCIRDKEKDGSVRAAFGFPPGVYLDDTKEYRFRYNPFRPVIFRGQQRAFQRLLAHCRSHNINLIVVEMPLTEQNLALMPPGFYRQYADAVRMACLKFGTSLLDLQREPHPTAWFFDSVHLNRLGGWNVITRLARAADKSGHSLAAR